MTESTVRQLAQSDPVPNLTAIVGQTTAEARSNVESLTATLRALDKLIETLAEHKITVDVDLGPIGNAAAAARRDLERERPGPHFHMPTLPDKDTYRLPPLGVTERCPSCKARPGDPHGPNCAAWTGGDRG